MPKGKKWEPKNKDEEIIYKSFLNSKRIKECMDRIKECSKDKYYPWLRDFFVFINQKPDTYIINGETIFDRKKLIEYTQKWENHIIDFFNHLMNPKPTTTNSNNPQESTPKPPAPKTYRQAKASISKLLKTHRIVLSDLFWEELNNLLPKDKTSTNFEMLDKEQLEKIFNCLDNQGKAIFLIQMNSGSRLDEILNLKMDNIDINHEFPRFSIGTHDSKNDELAIKRMSPEAKKFYKFYLTEREKWLKTKNNRSKGKGKTGIEGRAFPMTKQNAIDKWNNAVKKAGLFHQDENTGISKTGSHMLRKYFRKQCKKANQMDFGRWMANHGKNIDDTYVFDDYTPKEIDTAYSSVVEHLLVFGKTDVSDPKIRILENKIENLTRESTVKDEKLDYMKTLHDNLTVRFEKIEHILTRKIDDDVYPPTKGIKLTEEENSYENIITNQEIENSRSELQKELNEGKHKGAEISMKTGKPLLIKTKKRYSYEEAIEIAKKQFEIYEELKNIPEEQLNRLFNKLKSNKKSKSNQKPFEYSKKDKKT